jgi:hypothetical protein
VASGVPPQDFRPRIRQPHQHAAHRQPLKQKLVDFRHARFR